jgi:hypothetical protein
VNNFRSSVINASSEVAIALGSLCSDPGALERLERLARANALESLPLVASDNWLHFAADVRKTFLEQDYVIIKNLPVTDNGATLLIAASTIGSMFRTYRGGQIVKHFKMSPWTKELSHTIREGEFHTDLNTENPPPPITAMQCLDPDPGAPEYGVSRVARLEDILFFLDRNGLQETLQFLTHDTATMLNDRSSSSWSGQIVEKGLIRYHPETLRAAARRFGYQEMFLTVLTDRIAEVSKASIEVSVPFILERGDVLLLSNHRTLHYRGECSVVFKKYPMEFISRSIFILHANQETLDS